MMMCDVHPTYYVLGSEITVSWLHPRLAPESRSFVNDKPVHRSWGSSRENNSPLLGLPGALPGSAGHTAAAGGRPGQCTLARLCQQPVGETVSALRCTMVLSAFLFRCCPQGTFPGTTELFLTRSLQGVRTFPRVCFLLQ